MTDKGKNRFWIEPIAGLGNRMQVLASAYYYAQKYGKKLIILWNNNGDVGADFYKVFSDIPKTKVYVITTDGYRKKPFLRIYSELIRKTLKWRSDFYTDVDLWDGLTQDEIMGLIDKGMQKNCVYIKSWKQFTPVYESDNIKVDFLKPSKMVMEKGKTIFDQIDKHTVGVHIRRTDHEEAIAGSPIKAFVREMQSRIEADSECSFFLATDDQCVKKEIQDYFGNRVFFNKEDNISRNNEEGILNACIELWGLSKCKEIIGSKGSTFSMMAAKIGKIDLSIATM